MSQIVPNRTTQPILSQCHQITVPLSGMRQAIIRYLEHPTTKTTDPIRIELSSGSPKTRA